MTQSSDSSRRVWFITGAGRGLGRAFTRAALEEGDRVVATVRRPEQLDDLRAQHEDALRVLTLDVRDRQAALRTVEAAWASFGKLDVVVNNAGYGLVGAIEEVSEAEARDQLETNFFGALWVTQAVLPRMRERRSGHIVQVSTVGAVGTMPLLGLYNASKWALEGFSEALASEVADFGLRVTLAELGGFATDWAWSSMRFAQNDPAYNPLRERIFGTPSVPWDPNGKQHDTSADPALAARALIAHINNPSPGPLRLLIGDDAKEQVSAALSARRDDYAKNRAFTWPSRS